MKHDTQKLLPPPTPRQQKLIQIIHENTSTRGMTKSKGEMLREAGYGKRIACNPSVILDSPVIQAGIEGLTKQMENKARLALKHITESKFRAASAESNARVVKTLFEVVVALNGKPTPPPVINNVLINLQRLSNDELYALISPKENNEYAQSI